MKRVVFFLTYWLWLSSASSQGDLSYTTTSILPRHLINSVEVGDKTSPSVDVKGFLWSCSFKGLECFDGEKVIYYNNGGTRDNLTITTEGGGYSNGQLVDQRYYWAIERNSRDLICFDVVARKLVTRLQPPAGKMYYTLSKDEHEGLFAISMADQHADKSIYKIENLDTTHLADLDHPARIKDYAVYNKRHWLRYDDDIHQYDKSGTLLKAYGTKTASCMYFSKGPTDRLVLYSACTTKAKIYDGQLDALVDISFPPELMDKQYNIYHFGDRIWLVGQQINVKMWDLSTNAVEDYTAAIIEEYQTKENTTPVHKFSDIFTDNDGVYYLFSGELLMRLAPRSKTRDDFAVEIDINRPALSMRETAEDLKGNLYTSFYTGVAVRKEGERHFQDFRYTSSTPKVKEATYSLTVWNNKLIWNNIIFDLNGGDQDFIVRPEYGFHINHQVLGDTLWSFWWQENALVKTDLQSGKSIVVKQGVFDIPLSASAFEYDESTGHFWISTGVRGIISFDKAGEVIDRYELNDLVMVEDGRFINELCKADSLLWYGTQSGLNCFNLNNKHLVSFRSEYTSSVGVPEARAIYSIYPRDDTTFYLGTSRGIVKFNTRSKTMQALVSNHGLADLEFNRNSTFEASDGRYYFGTVDGLYSFVDEDLEFERGGKDVVPWVYKVEVVSNSNNEKRVISTGLGQEADLVLSADESYLGISFASPSFDQQARYRYQFADVQEDWIPTNSTITIPSLQAGKHRIYIKNSADAEKQPSNYTQINIYKKQYWYKKGWVMVLLVVALIGLVTILQRWLYQQRLKREKDLANLRTKISSDLHDDVGSILSGLAMQSEMMTYQVEESKRSELREISAMSRDAMERMRDTVWTIDSRKDKYENLIDRMRSFAEKALGRKDIDHSFEVVGVDGKRPISPLLRQNVYLIFKEAITNTVKHSDGNNVAIDFSRTGDRYRLTIADNGVVSSDEQLPSSGLGLSNMQLRAKNIDGQLSVTADSGFVVTLSYEE